MSSLYTYHNLCLSIHISLRQPGGSEKSDWAFGKRGDGENGRWYRPADYLDFFILEIQGDDAFLIDQIKIDTCKFSNQFRDPSDPSCKSYSTQLYGANNNVGWCLSTDPREHFFWKEGLSVCEAVTGCLGDIPALFCSLNLENVEDFTSSI